MSTRKMVYTALFAALGIVIPQLFHIIGGQGAGTIFLPMHYPVLIGAMLLGPISGVFIAVVSIVVGITLGMPPMAIGIFMLFELVTYGLVVGFLYNIKRLPVYISLIVGMVLGRLVEIVVIQVALALFAVKIPPVFGSIAMFATSVPGMIIQLILIPSIIIVLEKAVGHNKRLIIE